MGLLLLWPWNAFAAKDNFSVKDSAGWLICTGHAFIFVVAAYSSVGRLSQAKIRIHRYSGKTGAISDSIIRECFGNSESALVHFAMFGCEEISARTRSRQSSWPSASLFPPPHNGIFPKTYAASSNRRENRPSRISGARLRQPTRRRSLLLQGTQFCGQNWEPFRRRRADLRMRFPVTNKLCAFYPAVPPLKSGSRKPFEP